MHSFFFLAHYYPVLAVCMCTVIGQIGYFYRRKKDPIEYACWAMIAIFGITTLLWVYFRGDLHSDLWVRKIIG